jgi:hypothetical protein
MMRYFFAVITIIPASLASSETNGGDWWKNCPGPACPARNPSESYMDMPIHKNNAGDAPPLQDFGKDRDQREELIKKNDKDDQIRYFERRRS